MSSPRRFAHRDYDSPRRVAFSPGAGEILTSRTQGTVILGCCGRNPAVQIQCETHVPVFHVGRGHQVRSHRRVRHRAAEIPRRWDPGETVEVPFNLAAHTLPPAYKAPKDQLGGFCRESPLQSAT